MIMFHHGNENDYLLKLLSLLLHLISLTPALNYYGTNTTVKFTESCFKQPKISYTHGTIVNIYIAYELGASSPYHYDPTLEYCLFGAVTLTKNTDINKYGYWLLIILVMELDLIEIQIFHFQMVDSVKIK